MAKAWYTTQAFTGAKCHYLFLVWVSSSVFLCYCMCYCEWRKNTSFLCRVSCSVDLWKAKLSGCWKNSWESKSDAPESFLWHSICTLWLTGSNLTCTIACNKDEGNNFSSAKATSFNYLFACVLKFLGCMCTFMFVVQRYQDYGKGRKQGVVMQILTLITTQHSPCVTSLWNYLLSSFSCCLMYQQSPDHHLLISGVNAPLMPQYGGFNVNTNGWSACRSQIALMCRSSIFKPCNLFTSYGCNYKTPE